MKVFIGKKNNQKRVESLITKNEKTSMLSIYFRDFKTLGLGDEEKFVLILDGPEEYLKIAESLIKGFVETPDENLEKEIIKKFNEEENRAKEGFGFLFS
ncbi:MAG: hypothetical protein QXS69_02255 [Candidatus Aenigmatarchaeota archaeon]